MISSEGIRIKDKRIKTIKQWLKLLFLWDIQVFFGFANFYRRFFQEFSQIGVLFALMLKILSIKSVKPRNDVVGVDNDSKKEHNDRVKLGNKNKIGSNKVNGHKFDNDDVIKKKNL